MIGGEPRLLRLEHSCSARRAASGEVRFPERPGQPIRAAPDRSQLDLSSELGGAPAAWAGGGGTAARPRPWVADVRFDRVLLAKATPASAWSRRMSSTTASRCACWTRPRRARSEPRGDRAAGAGPPAAGVGARDAGALFHALGVTDTVHGGTLAVDAVFDDRRP